MKKLKNNLSKVLFENSTYTNKGKSYLGYTKIKY